MIVFLSLKITPKNMNKYKFIEMMMYIGVRFVELVSLTFDNTQKPSFPTFFLLYPQQQKSPKPLYNKDLKHFHFGLNFINLNPSTSREYV